MKRQRENKDEPPSTTLAIADTAFLMREEMRSQRLVLEFDRAELILQDHGITHEDISQAAVFAVVSVPCWGQTGRGKR